MFFMYKSVFNGTFFRGNIIWGLKKIKHGKLKLLFVSLKIFYETLINFFGPQILSLKK